MEFHVPVLIIMIKPTRAVHPAVFSGELLDFQNFGIKIKILLKVVIDNTYSVIFIFKAIMHEFLVVEGRLFLSCYLSTLYITMV
jgi:hypothetical protein